MKMQHSPLWVSIVAGARIASDTASAGFRAAKNEKHP